MNQSEGGCVFLLLLPLFLVDSTPNMGLELSDPEIKGHMLYRLGTPQGSSFSGKEPRLFVSMVCFVL